VVSSDEADASEVRVELVHRDLLAKEVREELSDGEKEALSLVAQDYSKTRQVVESSMLAPPSIFQACLIVDGNVARHPATATGVFNQSLLYIPQIAK